MSEGKEEMGKFEEDVENYSTGLRNFMENAPLHTNPMAGELRATQYHLQQTKLQLEKMTDLVESLSKQLVEITKAAFED